MGIFSFIKSSWLFIVLAVIAFLLIGLSLFFPEQKSQPSPTPKTQAQSWNKITPGKTSFDEVKEKLGEPIETRQRQSQTILFYPSESESLNHEVVISQNTVGFIKEQVIGDTRKLSYYVNQFGEPKAKLYGPYAASGYLLNIFPENGIAILAHADHGLVFENWYFEPTTLEDFLQKWGQGLSENPPQQL